GQPVGHRHPGLGHIVPDDRDLHRLRGPDPGPAGVHLHAADRGVHRWIPTRRTLTTTHNKRRTPCQGVREEKEPTMVDLLAEVSISGSLGSIGYGLAAIGPGIGIGIIFGN